MEPGHLGGIAILNADDVMLNIMGRITHNDEYYAMNHDEDDDNNDVNDISIYFVSDNNINNKNFTVAYLKIVSAV